MNMKKGLGFTLLALLLAAGGAVLAIFALKKSKEDKEYDEDDFELKDSVYFEDDTCEENGCADCESNVANEMNDEVPGSASEMDAEDET